MAAQLINLASTLTTEQATFALAKPTRTTSAVTMAQLIAIACRKMLIALLPIHSRDTSASTLTSVTFLPSTTHALVMLTQGVPLARTKTPVTLV
jgi:hypothetical protein